nr:MAG TPA: hypothetical protein [Crassvirales sp.]
MPSIALSCKLLYLSISVIPFLASFSAFQVQSSYSQFHVSFPFHVSYY